MITENKLRKYLLYAIGEIVLVVIGILIALQVNNLNQDRKAKDKEIVVLHELIEGLSSDLGIISFNIKRHEEAINSCNIILRALSENEEYNDSLALHFASTHNYTVFGTNRAAYESIKSIGFDIITNKDLRFKMINLYDQEYTILNSNNKYLTDDIFHIKRNFNQDYFDKFSILNNKTGKAYSGEMIPINFNQLKKNLQYRYHLKSLLASHKGFLMLMNPRVATKIEKVINDSKEEIERLKR